MRRSRGRSAGATLCCLCLCIGVLILVGAPRGGNALQARSATGRGHTLRGRGGCRGAVRATVSTRKRRNARGVVSGGEGASGSSSASKTVPVSVELTKEEQGLFDILLNAVDEAGANTTLRVAGGWVRDKLLLGGPHYTKRANPKVDVDVALDDCSGVEFSMMLNRYLERHGEKSHAVGIVSKNPEKSKHLETATMHIRGFSIDFVNLRTELYSQDSRIPRTIIGTPEEDAFRRDLTINALFYNIRTRQVEDYTGKGAQDLAAGAVRTPLPAMTTLLDDPLRVLRAIRFASRLRFSMAPELLEACMHPDVHTALGRKVSRERIGAEIDLMVRSHEPLRAFQLIHELNLAPVVFPLPSNTSPGPEAFGFSLVYLRNMHHLLEAHALKDAGVGWSTEQSKEFQQQRRIALYAAFLLPFADTKVQPDKPKSMYLAKFLLGEMLKLKAKDGEQVHVVHVAALELQLLLRKTLRGNIHGGNNGFVLPNRLELGQILRKVGNLWRVALLLALTGDLGTNHILGSAALGPRKREEDDAVIGAYVSLAKSIKVMGLIGIWELKPLLSGIDVLRLLPSLPKGPIFRDVMEDQISWMIMHPDLGPERIKGFLLEKYAEFRPLQDKTKAQ